MSIRFISVKCPDCGASLNVEEGRKQVFCSYCGAKIMVENNNEYTYHRIDDAEIKKAETERIIQLKKIELAEKQRADEKRRYALKVVASVILGIVAFFSISAGSVSDSMGIIGIGMFACFMIVFLWTNNIGGEEEAVSPGDKIRVPNAITFYQGKNYGAIETILRSAGFTNIKCVPLGDLTTGLLIRPGMVESITVNGIRITSGGKKFSPDASVVISYHSFSS